MRTLISQDPYASPERDTYHWKAGVWPCYWISCPDAGMPPFVTAYRCRFALDETATVRVHVTADERYELFLDGARIGRGSERGDADNWFFETYDLPIDAGEHVMVARVWSMGERAAFAQMSVYPGFLLAPQEEKFWPVLGTGVADWEAKKLGGYAFTDPDPAWGTGANLVVSGKEFDWGFARGIGDDWLPGVKHDVGAEAGRKNDYAPMHLLKPATLPAMREERWAKGVVRLVADVESGETHAVPVRAQDNIAEETGAWQALLRGEGSVTIPANTRRRVLIDLEDYVCAYPEAVTSGGDGGRVRIDWQEALYNEPDARSKGNRSEIEGKYFVSVWKLVDGVGDEFLPDGGEHRKFDTLWWQCGRYVEVLAEAADEALTIEGLAFRETRYPMEWESGFESSDKKLQEIVPIAVRALQMCSHETYMDCPFYEQLMYAGDTRLEILATYVTTQDGRLPKKAMEMFRVSRLPTGLTFSRYPSRVTQIIPPFSLWWVAMVYDWALWRGDLDFVRQMMPDARGVLDTFEGFITSDGLVGAPKGWNFVDWVNGPGWESGVPPGGNDSVSGPLNWQYVLALKLAAELEEALGEPELAARNRQRASNLVRAIQSAFWDEARGLFADDRDKQRFSEHSQCLAILSGQLGEDQRKRVAEGLFSAPDLARTTIYFTHYLFETFYSLGRPDTLQDRLSLWFTLTELGLKTTVEMPEPTRSDCHAWGAHPLYHYFASILGIRPASFGFETVRIAPQLGPLTHARGCLVHPKGKIAIDLKADADGLTGSITLPEGVRGVFEHGGKTIDLPSGKTVL